jgi:N-acetylglucosaminyldiphosphoundecaprenol N-acetyl-beta-D-mannosaminyltransferase
MRRCGLEWSYRLACEPRRLARRYLRDAWYFPQLVWQEFWRNPGRKPLPASTPGFAGRRID